MTLILTSVNNNYVTLASDTRLTDKDGKPVDDNAVKCIKLDCSDGSFLIGYTGIARVNGIKTDHWLVDILTTFKAGNKQIQDVIKHLKQELDKYFSSLKLDAKTKRTTVVVAGWAYTTDGTVPLVLSVSNCEDAKLNMLPEARDTFSINISTRKKEIKSGYMIALNGAELAIDERYFDHRIKRLAKFLRHASSEEGARTIRNQSVKLIRIGASHRKWGHYIGKNCITATLPKEQPGSAECEYYPIDGKKKMFMPHMVSGPMTAKDIVAGGDFVNGNFKLEVGWRPSPDT
jgi:hypothetical protein